MMTRKEAALIHARNMGCTVDNAELFVKSLEALGLIKFDEEIECLYQSKNDDKWGTVKILEYDKKELSIWIGGKHRFTLKKEDV